jgi:DNA repair photolyase
MIISASRRTDIPAFYTPWFMNRIRDGFLLTRNPFNEHQVRRVSLSPQDVDVIIFWTRNPRMLMQHLNELDSLGYNYYFQYTITGYPKELENSVPRPHRAIKTFINLSDRIGADRVIWRYDPILISNLVDINEHKRIFSKIAAMLYGKTRKVVISFADFYKKTERKLALVNGLEFSDITLNANMLNELVDYMSSVAKKYNMSIETCAEKVSTSSLGVSHGKCIDDTLIKNIFGISLSHAKDSGQREACGCIKSIDIGSYNTCLHECSYCYATFSKEVVLNNKSKHDPKSPFLIGGVENTDLNLLLPPIIQRSLF